MTKLSPQQERVLDIIREAIASGKPYRNSDLARANGIIPSSFDVALAVLRKAELIPPSRKQARRRSLEQRAADIAADDAAKICNGDNPQRKKRPCINCRVPRMSEGPGDRYCPTCRTYANSNSGVFDEPMILERTRVA